MNCPQCKSRHHRTISTNHRSLTDTTVRRRECRKCNHRFTSVEIHKPNTTLHAKSSKRTLHEVEIHNYLNQRTAQLMEHIKSWNETTLLNLIPLIENLPQQDPSLFPVEEWRERHNKPKLKKIQLRNNTPGSAYDLTTAPGLRTKR